MKRLLEFLFPICFHEWEIESKQELYRSNFSLDYIENYLNAMNQLNNVEKLPIGCKYTLRCKKCGEMKTFYDQLKYSK